MLPNADVKCVVSRWVCLLGLLAAVPTFGCSDSDSGTITDGQWGEPTLIEHGPTGGVYNPRIALNASGQALAVWFQFDALDRFSIWANRFTRGAGWGAAQRLSTGDIGYRSLEEPQVAVDPDGRGLAVWSQSDGIWASNFTPDGGWSVAERIATNDTGDAGFPQVAMDRSGQAIALWSQSGGIWANRFAPDTGWGIAERIATGSLPQVATELSVQAVELSGEVWVDLLTGWVPSLPSGAIWAGARLAVDPNGQAVAMWVELEGESNGFGFNATDATVWASHFTPTEGWGLAERLDTDDVGLAGGSAVAVASNGTALAVWSQSDGNWVKHFTPKDGWGIAEHIPIDGYGAQIALEANGSALAIWLRSDGVSSTRFTPGTGWSVPEVVTTDENGIVVGNPRLVIDPTGQAIAVWEQSGNIWANRFAPTEGWGSAERIATDDDAGNAVSPQIAVAPSGDAVVLWTQEIWSGGNPREHSFFWANRFSPTDGWGAGERIPTGDVLTFSGPRVAVDPNGEALAVWTQAAPTRFGESQNVGASRFTPTAGWSIAEQIATGDDPPSINYPQVAVDPDGRGIAVWLQGDASQQDRYSVWANRFTPDTGWGIAERIASDDASVSYYGSYPPQVGMDANGGAIAVWAQEILDRGGGIPTIWANRFSPTEGWGLAERITTEEFAYGEDPQVAVDPSGHAIAVWRGAGDIWANRFAPATGWGVAEPIPAAADARSSAERPRVAADPNGPAIVVWQQQVGTQFDVRRDIFASRFTQATGWGAAERITTDDGGAYSAEVAIDPSGRALAIWSQPNPDGLRTDVWSNRFAPEAGWGMAERITTDEEGDAVEPQLAIESSGRALAVWSQAGNIWASRFE